MAECHAAHATGYGRHAAGHRCMERPPAGRWRKTTFPHVHAGRGRNAGCVACAPGTPCGHGRGTQSCRVAILAPGKARRRARLRRRPGLSCWTRLAARGGDCRCRSRGRPPARRAVPGLPHRVCGGCMHVHAGQGTHTRKGRCMVADTRSPECGGVEWRGPGAVEGIPWRQARRAAIPVTGRPSEPCNGRGRRFARVQWLKRRGLAAGPVACGSMLCGQPYGPSSRSLMTGRSGAGPSMGGMQHASATAAPTQGLPAWEPVPALARPSAADAGVTGGVVLAGLGWSGACWRRRPSGRARAAGRRRRPPAARAGRRRSCTRRKRYRCRCAC